MHIGYAFERNQSTRVLLRMDEKSVNSLQGMNISPDNEVVRESLQQSERLPQRISEAQLREELGDDIQQFCPRLKLYDQRSDLAPGPRAPVFCSLLPRAKLSQYDEYGAAVNDISRQLADQRHQLALDRKNVQIENLTLDNRRLQEQSRSSQSRAESLAVELKTLQETLTQAQWGVVQYHTKCDKQRRQLGDVQIANANLKRENARLRDDVKRLRRRAREAEAALMAPPEEVKGSCLDHCGTHLDSEGANPSTMNGQPRCDQDDDEQTPIGSLDVDQDLSQSREVMRRFLSRPAESPGNFHRAPSQQSDAHHTKSSGDSDSGTCSDCGHDASHASMGSSQSEQEVDVSRMAAE